MKITRIEPAQGEEPEALTEAPAPEPPPPTPEQIAERQAAADAALSGTKALLVELQSRRESVESELTQHRQAADAGFDGAPADLPAWLAGVEQHRSDAARLATEAGSLKRQIPVAAALLAKLEAEQADRETARTQAAGRALLKDAIAKYEVAALALADAILDLGASAILAGQPTSFIAATRSICITDLLALGHSLPALVGFIKRREGQTVNQSDPEFQRRANLLRNAS